MGRIKVTVTKYNPDLDKNPRKETYEVPFQAGVSIRTILEEIHRQYGLAFRCGCGVGYCNICVVRVNGKNRIACRTLVRKPAKLVIEPATGYCLIRDLVVANDRRTAK
jgi:succinate dehydrogenase/fumarate reductase-like Fe-S protein